MDNSILNRAGETPASESLQLVRGEEAVHEHVRLAVSVCEAVGEDEAKDNNDFDHFTTMKIKAAVRKLDERSKARIAAQA